VPARVFEPAVAAHLAGVYGPLEWTFYEGVSQLAPGHALVADASGARVWRFWDIDPDERLVYRREEEYVEHFREVFVEAVRARLRSVKPVGILLSGGMDSGAVASTAGWLIREEGVLDPSAFRAYSWAFEELPECDERHISKGISDHYGFPAVDVPADDAWPLKDYPAHGPDQDEPFIGIYQATIERSLEIAHADGVGVLLGGDRGDLMVGDRVFDHLGLATSGRWGQLGQDLRDYRTNFARSWPGVVKSQLARPLLLTAWPQAENRPRFRRPPCPPPWITPAFARRAGLADLTHHTDPHPTVTGHARRQRYEHVFMFLHMRGMIWSERTYAGLGLGFADPWSDRRVASFVLAVPQWVVQRPGQPKRLARQAMRGIMPEPVRHSARKIIPMPLYLSALRERASETVRDLLTDSRVQRRDYVDPGTLRAHYEACLSGSRISPDFWSALTLEMWLRRIEPVAQPHDPAARRR
jgi:asparagine synthase (glutamine-hydrolysing)